MDLRAVFSDMGTYLLVQVSGEWAEKTARQAVEDVDLEARKHDRSRVLLNVMEVLPPQRMFTRFTTAADMAQVWGDRLKVAAVWKQEYINQFAENVAVNRGVMLRVFTDEEHALEWLLQD